MTGNNKELTSVRFLAGGMAAGVAEVVTLPIDVAKVRLQVQVNNAINGKDNTIGRASATPLGKPKADHKSAAFTRFRLPNAKFIHRNIIKRIRPHSISMSTTSTPSGLTTNSSPALMSAQPGQIQYRGMFHAMMSIRQSEGWKGLFRGISPAVARQFSYSALTLAAYEPTRNTIAQFLSTNNDATGKEGISFGVKFLSGGIAGGLSVAAVNPFDVVKVRMQAGSDGKRLNQGTMRALKTLWTSEGYKGMVTGIKPSVQRAIIVNAAELATYDHSKRLVSQYTSLPLNSVATLFLASVLAGFVSAVTSNPIDVAKTRIMTQSRGEAVHKSAVSTNYTGMVDCLVKMVRHEGVSALYKGFIPNWARKGPHVVVTFLVYEKLRAVFAGDSSSMGH